MSMEKSSDGLIQEFDVLSLVSCRLIAQIIFPLTGGFLFGYDTGIISGAIILIRNQFHLTSITQEIIVSATILSAAISAMIIGAIAELFGRKPILFLAGLTFVIGSLVMSLAQTIPALIIGRLIVGIGVGVCATVCPIYLAEISPEQIRGRIILMYNASIVGGQLTATVVSAIFYKFGTEGWRYMFGIAVIPGFIQCIGMLLQPESYRWLIKKERISQAREIIIADARVPQESVESFIQDIVQFNQRINSIIQPSTNQINSRRDSQELESTERDPISTTKQPPKSDWILFKILRDPTARYSLLIGCILQMLQQIIGINTIMYYTGPMLQMAGVEYTGNIMWLSVLVVSCSFFSAMLGFILIDKIGRRRLGLGSLTGVILSLLALAVVFQMMAISSTSVNSKIDNLTTYLDNYCADKSNCEYCTTSPNCGFCQTNVSQTTCLAVSKNFANHSDKGSCFNTTSGSDFYYGYCKTDLSKWIVVGICLYLISFNIGMGPVPWTVTAEIYPLWCREINMSLSTSTNWTFNLIISLTFLSLTETITKYGTFYLFTGFSFVGWFFIYFCMPETSQKTLEEITGEFEVS